MEPCPRCGAENPSRARFCLACGEPLLRDSARRGEIRKTVTILFIDVVGSTELAERLEPEVTRRVMGRLFDVVSPVLEHHGGSVEKFIGDAIMAVFGIPAVHEDDAMRGCRAAMEIQSEISRLNEEFGHDWGITISTRTGINTGEVIAGDSSLRQSLVTGDAVSTAARLEQAAPSDSVLIGESTYRSVSHAVEVEPINPVAAKGKASAVTAYRLLSVVPGSQQRARRLDSPMVGRRRELDVLGEVLDRSIKEPKCVLATVIGMPGVGKSRLIQEFAASRVDQATVLQGRCLPYGEGITFWPVANVVHQAARIKESDSVEDARARIGSLLAQDNDRDIVRDRVAAAIGLGEATWSIEETFWAIRRLLESLARDRSLIVLFDDVHWGEPTFLDLIEYLEGWSSGFAILILCAARPELLDMRAGWPSAATAAATLTLDPLDEEESDRLIVNLLNPNEASDDFRRRIAETAEGNPLFVEELVGKLIDENRLKREAGRWVVVDEPSSIATPHTIQTLLATRVEQLPARERQVLQIASVIGATFWWGAVADLSFEDDRMGVASQLQDLVRRGLIRPEQSTMSRHDAFRFRHILIREAAYRSVPKLIRADLHERCAQWIERTVGRAEEYDELVGYHLEQSWQLGSSLATTRRRELGARAFEALASAGRRSLRRGDVNGAQNLLSRASVLSAPDDDRGALEIRLSLAEVSWMAGNFRQADELLREVSERARVLQNQWMEWSSKVQLGQILARTTNVSFEQVIATANQATKVFTRLGDPLALSKSLALFAWVSFHSGQAAVAQGAASEAAVHAAAAGDLATELDQLAYAAAFATYGPSPVSEGLELCGATLRRVDGHPSYEADTLLSEGLLEAMSGSFDTARTAVNDARSILTELGNSLALAKMNTRAADVEWYTGDMLAEERERRAGYEAFVGLRAGGYRAASAASLARLEVDLGRDDAALELTFESEGIAADDDVNSQVPWRSARARVLARRGDVGEAERLALEAVSIAERSDWLNLRGDAQMALADVLWISGRSKEATDAAHRAVKRYKRKGNIVAEGWARQLLQDLHGTSQQ